MFILVGVVLVGVDRRGVFVDVFFPAVPLIYDAFSLYFLVLARVQ